MQRWYRLGYVQCIARVPVWHGQLEQKNDAGRLWGARIAVRKFPAAAFPKLYVLYAFSFFMIVSLQCMQLSLSRRSAVRVPVGDQ